VSWDSDALRTPATAYAQTLAAIIKKNDRQQMGLRLIIGIILTLTLIQCTKFDERPWRTCLGEDISTKIELLDKSFKLSLGQNNLKDTESFLKIIAANGDSVFHNFIIPKDAQLTIEDINDLHLVLWTKEGTYSQNNKLIQCLKSCSSCQTDLVIGYINDKNAAGYISPTVTADGLLQTADQKELTDRLITDLIIFEIYLPLLKTRGQDNGR
jgi:hypothetical protein